MLGGVAIVLFLSEGVGPVNSIIEAHEQLTLSNIPAIPLFTLAGFLLAEGKASDTTATAKPEAVVAAK